MLETKGYEKVCILAKKEAESTAQESTTHVTEEAAQAQTEGEGTHPWPETEQVVEHTTETQQEAMAPVSAKLQDDKLTNEEPPPALIQPPATLASIEPTTEETANLQTGASSQPKNILAISEED